MAVGLYARFVDGEDRPARSTYLRNRRNGSRRAGSDAIPATFRRSAKYPRGRSCSRSADHRARRFRPAIRGLRWPFLLGTRLAPFELVLRATTFQNRDPIELRVERNSWNLLRTRPNAKPASSQRRVQAHSSACECNLGRSHRL